MAKSKPTNTSGSPKVDSNKKKDKSVKTKTITKNGGLDRGFIMKWF